MVEAWPDKKIVGKYVDHWEKGVYTCYLCNEKVFSSKAKYEPYLSMPAFYEPITNQVIEVTHPLKSRNTITAKCVNCGSHLGDVIILAYAKIGRRIFIINSSSLNFVPDEVKVKN